MKLQVTTYEGTSSKIKSADQELTFLLLSDLHQKDPEKKQEELLDAAAACRPDAIFAAGDMIVGEKGQTAKAAQRTLLELAKTAPVFYADGNHETRLKKYDDKYDQYRNSLRDGGVHYLENTSEAMRIRGVFCRIYGLELPLSYYDRFRRISLDPDAIQKRIGKPDPDAFNILMAHHPRYGECYFKWGADLILSGHVHGGVMRIGNRPVLSPDGRIFPKYGYGWFQKHAEYMAVGAGVGDHTIPIRIRNPRELVRIVIKQEVPHGDTR